MNNKIFTLIFLIAACGLSSALAQNTPQTTPKTISAGVVNGKAKILGKPTYPEAAKAVKASGAVNVQVTIDEEGNILSATAVSGHPLLRAAAVEAARASKFSPTMLNGQPVKVSGVIVYNFVPDTPAEFKEPYWALGILIALIHNADPQLIAALNQDKDASKNEDFDSILRDIAKTVPEEFAAQKPLFAKLVAAKPEERRSIAGELSISFKNRLQGNELWQYEIGENLSGVIIECVKYMLEGKNEMFEADEPALRASLQKIKNSLGAIPEGISSEFSKQLEEIALFADKEDLLTPKTMSKLFMSLEPLFDKIITEDE